jgi:hypothetical protein
MLRCAVLVVKKHVPALHDHSCGNVEMCDPKRVIEVSPLWRPAEDRKSRHGMPRL